jgi:regulator of RNase E activity RraA
VIVGDSNGVVVVPQDIVEEMVRRLTAQQSAESDYTAAVARGEFNNNWVDKTLSDAGVPLVNGNHKAPAAQPQTADS